MTDVVDDSDIVGWAAAATRVGEVYMSDVPSMVVSVKRAAGQKPIKRLNILDHGNAEGVEIGEDWVDVSTFSNFESYFLLLRGRFAQGGFVHLQHCQVGSNHALLTMFAKAFGVLAVACRTQSTVSIPATTNAATRRECARLVSRGRD